MTFLPAADRYDSMQYRRTGRSGLHLPAISLGLWQNFGGDRPFEEQRPIIHRAFDLGVTHPISLTTTGRSTSPPRRTSAASLPATCVAIAMSWSSRRKPGTACGPVRMVMGIRKYLLASLDQSLARLGAGLR